MADASLEPRRVGVVGAGSIGVAFALVFARAGWQVNLQDPDAARRVAVPQELRSRLDALHGYGLLKESPQEVAARVSMVAELQAAVAGATLVLECAPEKGDVKRALFEQMDSLAPPEAILASASSAIPSSAFTAELAGRARCLIAHPGNPPYLIPVIELVPAPYTDQVVVQTAKNIFASVGMVPVLVAKEVEGFVFNRLQGALLREAYCLVRDGVASVEDIDRVVRHGLGQRWAFIGPFETVDLNTRGGIASHAQKMGPAYERMGAERGQHDPWTPELVAKVEAQRRELLPLSDWEARVAWRDQELMRRAALNKKE